MALSAKRREKLPPGAVIVAAMKFVRGTAQELINWQKTEGFTFPVIAIVNNLNGPDLLEVMKDGGAVDVVQRAGIDKQLIETVGRYAKPEHVVLQLDHTLIPRKSQKFGEIQQDIADALGARTIDEGAMDEKNGMNFVNALEKIPGIIAQYEERTAKLKADVPQLEAIVAKTWGKENELKQLKYKKWKAQFLNGDDVVEMIRFLS